MRAAVVEGSRRNRPDQAGTIHRGERVLRYGHQLFVRWLPQLRGNYRDKVLDGVGLSVGDQDPQVARRRGEQVHVTAGRIGTLPIRRRHHSASR